MPRFDEEIVRAYFELNGFFVKRVWQERPSGSRSRKGAETAFLAVFNPEEEEPPSSHSPGFQLFAGDLRQMPRALVAMRGFSDSKFAPGVLRSSPQIFSYLKKDVLDGGADLFASLEGGIPESFAGAPHLLVLPAIPSDEPQRAEAIALLQKQGVQGILTFSTILENIIRQLQLKQSYSHSSLLEPLRLLKVYGMIKEPQMDLFDESAQIPGYRGKFT